jgi:hypothetical protein
MWYSNELASPWQKLSKISELWLEVTLTIIECSLLKSSQPQNMSVA